MNMLTFSIPGARLPGAWTVAIAAIAACAVAGCSNSTQGPYDLCEVEAQECGGDGIEGCSIVTVEYVDHDATQGFCTTSCTTDEECPLDSRMLNGACNPFDGPVAVCFERCRDDTDCPDGLACVDRLEDSAGMFRFFDAICLPR